MVQQVQRNSTRKGGERRNGPQSRRCTEVGGGGDPQMWLRKEPAPQRPGSCILRLEPRSLNSVLRVKDCCSPASQRGAFASCGDRQMGGGPGLQQSVLGAETTWRRWI